MIFLVLDSTKTGKGFTGPILVGLGRNSAQRGAGFTRAVGEFCTRKKNNSDAGPRLS